jgi:glycosyltransferase involved in cell wall biosynthesis
MKFSLVLATIHRTEEVERLLRSVDAQAGEEMELIVIDQNADGRLTSILERFRTRFAIRHLRAQPGLSRARNAGLRFVTGAVVAFPDDDGWYPPGLLRSVRLLLEGNPDWDGVTGRVVDEQGVECSGNFSTVSGHVDRYNVWARAVSSTIFLRRAVVEHVGRFDETLGLGSGTAFGSGEETDYMIRALQAGFRIEFLADLVVRHPNPERQIDRATLRKTYSYGCGMGRVLTKHRYPLWFKARALARPLGGAMLSLSSLRFLPAHLYWKRCVGRLRGLVSRWDSSTY